MNIKLFDLAADPEEFVDVSSSITHSAIRDDMLDQLLAHLCQTDRHPDRIPDGDKWTKLSHCVLPAEERL